MYNDRHRQTMGGLPIQKRNVSLAARTRCNSDEPFIKKLFSSSLLGLGANLLSGLVLVSAVSLIAYLGTDPLSLIPMMALLSLLPSNFIGGFVCAKKCGESHLACGALTSALWFIISLFGALCLYNSAPSGYSLMQNILLHGVSALFCILGAMTGGIKRKPSHKKRRFG